MSLYKEVVIRSIKILNIGWSTLAYFIMAVLTLYLLNKIYGEFDIKHYEKMSDFNFAVDFICYIWLIGVLIYVARNLFPLIPFPFDGVFGFDHNKVKEVTNASVFSIFIITFNKRMQGYYSIMKKKLFNF